MKLDLSLSLLITIKWIFFQRLSTLRKNCPYSELFWSVFSRTRTEYGEILRISPYSVLMRENTDQNNSEYGHFLRSGTDEFGDKNFKIETDYLEVQKTWYCWQNINEICPVPNSKYLKILKHTFGLYCLRLVTAQNWERKSRLLTKCLDLENL